MSQLSLDLFIGLDEEMCQYKIMSQLKNRAAELKDFKIYPYLAELIEFKNSLEVIVKSEADISKRLSKKICGINFETNQFIYETISMHDDQLVMVRRLIEWVDPIITELINEGTTIYDFVEKNLSLKTVGVESLYRREGYLFVEDQLGLKLNIYLYECSIYTNQREPYRTLRVQFIESFPLGTVRLPFVDIKRDLIKKRSELPNPCTFVTETDLAFPFEETILPVAKRMLIMKLVA